MNSFSSKEKTVDLKKLAIVYLKNWRTILITSVLGAVLLAGMGALKGEGTVKTLLLAVVGAAIGAVVLAVPVLAKYVMEHGLDSAGQIQERYEIPVLSDMHTAEGRYAACIDRLLEKWDGNPQSVDEKAACRALAQKLQKLCGENDSELVLCGAVEETSVKKLCKAIEKHLNGTKIRFAAAEESELKDKPVVLVEKLNGSSYVVTDGIMDRLTAAGAKILGCVVI